MFSPDEKLIATGTSIRKNEGAASIVFLERTTLNVVRRICLFYSALTVWLGLNVAF